MKNRSRELKAEPIDVTEQENIVHELKLAAVRQSSQTRLLFCLLFAAIGCIFFSCFCFSLLNPWEISHQSVFRDLVPLHLFNIFYAFSCFSFTVLGFSLTYKGVSALKVCAIAGSVLFSIIWVAIFWNYSVSNVLLMWIPCVNPFGILLASYVDYDTSKLLMETDQLKESMYEFKNI